LLLVVVCSEVFKLHDRYKDELGRGQLVHEVYGELRMEKWTTNPMKKMRGTFLIKSPASHHGTMLTVNQLSRRDLKEG
jgi:hypothetical protein